MWLTVALLALLTALLAAAGWWRERRERTRLQRALAGERDRQATTAAAVQQAELGAQVRQKTLFNSMSDGVLLLDREGRIQMVNAAFRQLFGLPAEVMGRPVIETIRLPAFAALLRLSTTTGHVRDEEIELAGVERRAVRISATTIHEPGCEAGSTVVVAHDLTRLKQLENTRRVFVANVSHELRTPLSLIKGSVETLLAGARHDPDAAEKFLRMIEKHADRLAFLIEDLLTISRLESGAVTLHREDVLLRPLVDRVFEELQTRTRKQPVHLENQVPVALTVRADEARLQQVLANLIENAIKYGRPEGHVWVDARQAEARWIEVRVRDDGSGISAADLDRIYERFYRVDKARSREQGGTGLGLAIVKHIVQSHGGEVLTESEIGQGSTFRFTLPAPTSAATPGAGD